MKPSLVAFLLFFAFLSVQGMRFAAHRFCPAVGRVDSVRGVVPVRVVADDTIFPPRRVVVVRPGHTPPGGKFAPVVAWVFGLRMNWREVTEENLRWIPGMSRTMAGRLVRIRDTMEIKDFRQVAVYPRVGEKTVKRLKRYCFIPHAD